MPDPAHPSKKVSGRPLARLPSEQAFTTRFRPREFQPRLTGVMLVIAAISITDGPASWPYPPGRTSGCLLALGPQTTVNIASNARPSGC